jgi:hypothetical protein
MNLEKLITGTFIGNVIKKMIGNVIMIYMVTRLIKKKNVTFTDAIKYGVAITVVQVILQFNVFPTVETETFDNKCNVCQTIRNFLKEHFVIIITVVIFFVYMYFFKNV